MADSNVYIHTKAVNGWRRFFTLTYWRFQIGFLLNGGRPLNIISVFTITVDDGKPLDCAAFVSDMPTSPISREWNTPEEDEAWKHL